MGSKCVIFMSFPMTLKVVWWTSTGLGLFRVEGLKSKNLNQVEKEWITSRMGCNPNFLTRLKLWFENGQCIRSFDFPNSTQLQAK
jgi:hypothetical protein